MSVISLEQYEDEERKHLEKLLKSGQINRKVFIDYVDALDKQNMLRVDTGDQFRTVLDRAAFFDEQPVFKKQYETTIFNVAWFYLIDGNRKPELRRYVIYNIKDYEAEIGRLFLNGCFIRQVHMSTTNIKDAEQPVLETPFKVTLGNDTIFELTDEYWIAKAAANILSYDPQTDAETDWVSGQYVSAQSYADTKTKYFYNLMNPSNGIEEAIREAAIRAQQKESK